MWNFIDSIPLTSLDSWYRWFTILAIGLPILGAVMGGMFGWGAFIVSNRIGNLQTAEIQTLQPWHLLEDQQKKLTEELHSLSPGNVVFSHRLMDGDGEDYAKEIAAIFKSAGWSIGGIGGSSLNDLPDKVAVATAPGSGAELLKTADNVCNALKGAGIPSVAEDLKPNSLGGPLEPGIIYIVIGRKQRHFPTPAPPHS